MTKPTDSDLTQDAFLGGKLHLYQPRKGYRAGIDAVLLAASIPAETGQRVLELGCGVGTAILCLGARIPGLSLTGLEREEIFADLARRNGGDRLTVVQADLTDMPLSLRQMQFDHVLANPPYYKRSASKQSENSAREAAHGEHTPLREWVRAAAKRLAPKGQVHFIHRIERLPDILAALPPDLGSVEVLPLSARVSRRPDRMLLRARKDGRAEFLLHKPFVLHLGETHASGGNRYVPTVQAILRDGAPLAPEWADLP